MDANLPDRRKRGLFAGIPVIIGCVLLLALVGVALLNRGYIGSFASCRTMMANIEGLELVSQDEPSFLQTYGALALRYHSTEDASTVEQLINGAYGRQIRERIEQGGPTAIRGIAPAANFTTAPAEGGGTDVRVICP